MSLDNATLSFISDRIKDFYSGNEIAGLAGKYCVSRGLRANFQSQGRYESKAKFTGRIFNSLTVEHQVGLLKFFVDKSETLQTDTTVQQLLMRLSQEYDLIPKTVEAGEKQTEIEHLLADFPESLDLWQKSLAHKQAFQYRESVDSARLSIELLLKQLLGNQKSLENQREDFSRWLGQQLIPNEIVNMIWKSIDDYTRVQNQHIKHALSDKLLPLEIDFVLDATYAIIKYLTKRAKEMSHE